MGFFANTNFGRSVESVGGDVATSGMLAQRGDQQMALLNQKIDGKLFELEQRIINGIGVGGARGAGAGRATGFAAEPTDIDRAAMSGMSVPDYKAARTRDVNGPATEDAGWGPGDRPETAAPVNTVETVASHRAGELAPQSRKGIIRSIINPQHLDDYEKGVNEATTREDVYKPGATTQDTRDAARRAAANAGKPMQDIKDDTTFDPFGNAGKPASTPLGKAKEGAQEALAGQRDARAALSDATDPNAPKGKGGGAGAKTKAQQQLDEADRAIEGQRKVIADSKIAHNQADRDRREEAKARLTKLQSERDRLANIVDRERNMLTTTPTGGGDARPPLSSFGK